ncbi:MAG: prolyl oligopeptidase family serine peptidase [Myxococcales bacterium]|nr:prolyl oligopeptidase family serine peptidase [Myxococcales bacterium]
MRILRPSTLLAASAAFSLFFPSETAFAECVVAPGPEGELSTWFALAPVNTPNTRPSRTVDAQLSQRLAGLDPAALEPRAAGRWQPIASPSSLFDPGSVLRGRGPRTMFFGATLHATTPTVIQLFTGADDGLAIFVDGNEVARRGAVREARDDDDHVRVELPAGRHRIVFRSYVHGGDQRAFVRMVGEDFRPVSTVRVVLDGLDDARCDELARKAARVRVERSPQAPTTADAPATTRVDVTLSYPGGTARRDGERTRELRIEGVAQPSASATLALDGQFAGSISASATLEASATRIRVSPSDARARRLDYDVRIEPATRRALHGAREALSALDEQSPPAWLPRGSLQSVLYHRQRLAALVSDGDEDREHIAAETAALEELVRDLRAQRDPYARRSGPLRRGYRTDVDGTLQGYSLYVPPSYRPDRATPVVMALHGLHGSAHRMLPILFGIYDKEEDRTHADRHFAALPDTRALLVAPYAHGDAFYRGVGEYDVLRVLDEVRRAYRTDADRTYMTGLSMGGTGASAIPLHYPDLFAAAAPLCGYHDYFVRTSAQGHRRPWETAMMEFRSSRNWAENGLHLPMYVVQGTLDRPVTNSTTFVDRYRQLGYTIESEYPELGHDVWSTTYAGGRIVPYFLRYSRDPRPSRVRFRTPSTRWSKSYWVELDAVAQSGQWAEIDAVTTQNRLRITTQNVRAMTVRPPLRPPFDIVVDGQAPLRITAEGGASLARQSAANGQPGPWSLVSERVVQRKLGPIREAFDGPILVVYGARLASESAMNRRVAESWANVPTGARMNVRIVADDAYQPSDARGRTVVLVGTPASHRVIERMQSSLPIRVQANEIRTHDRVIAGGSSAVFVAQSPDAEDGRVVVVTGTSALAVWRSRSLPELVPDYVVFDDRIRAARGRVLLGRYASIVCAGFYTPEGRVGPSCADVPPPASARPEDDARDE